MSISTAGARGSHGESRRPASLDSSVTGFDGAAPDDPTAAQAAAEGKRIVLHVVGSDSGALVKTLVVAGGVRHAGGNMVARALPFTLEIALPAGSVLRKILIAA